MVTLLAKSVTLSNFSFTSFRAQHSTKKNHAASKNFCATQDFVFCSDFNILSSVGERQNGELHNR